jgi:4-amino-4-deoxy-L-arabinose transferase-like glycosyltransferase
MSTAASPFDSPAPAGSTPLSRRETAPAAVPAARKVEAEWTPAWAEAVLRWRWVLVPAWLLMHLLAFNGQWRIGPDSATFRSVAHSLATGGGYAILGEPQRQVYPGLPLLLAGLERLFGDAVWPAILVMLAASAATLWLTYRLMRRVERPWVATLVTAGVGFNIMFVNHGHELLTDVPFLLGVMMALWGWETITDKGVFRRVRSGAWLAGGLALAVAMRPTFWVLALAFGVVCLGGLVVGLFPRFSPRWWTTGPDRARSWRFYAMCLAVVTVVGFAFAATDPRTRSLDLLAGGYEAEVAERVMSLGDRLRETPAKLWEMVEDHLEAAFFAERVEYLNLPLALSLLAGVLMVSRRRPLWGLLVAILLGALYFASSVPRYYLMVLPILWLGWVTLTRALAVRLFRTDRSRSLFAAVMFGLVLACNMGHVVKFTLEQRSRPFLEGYKDGLYVPIVAMSRAIEREVAASESVIGPYAKEMTYLSGRNVLGRRQLLSGHEATTAEKALKLRDSGAQWAVFPTSAYQKKDLPLYRLGRAGIFVPSNPDDSTVISVGTFDGEHWYLTRDWDIDETMIVEDGE